MLVFLFLQALYRQFRAILNKLTPQKFDVLVEKALALTADVTNKDRLEGMISIVFEKVNSTEKIGAL